MLVKNQLVFAELLVFLEPTVRYVALPSGLCSLIAVSPLTFSDGSTSILE
jgi:hypothetical protein